MKKIYTLLFFTLTITLLNAASRAKTGDLQFIQNNGQWQQPILFSAGILGGNLFLEKDCFTWAFSNLSELSDYKHKGNKVELENFIIKKHAFKTHFINANSDVQLSGESSFQNYYNYFLGDDETKWRGAVPAYGAVRYNELYKGIDLLIYSQSNTIKYDLIIAPKAESSIIEFNYEGLKDIRINNGNLELITSINTLMEIKPVAFQIISGTKVDVECNFLLKGSTIQFIFPNDYDHNYELIIDPATLIFASYSGATSDNWGYSATFDEDENLYGAGITFAEGYPVTLGAFEQNWTFGAGSYVADVTISKFTSDGTSLIYSTYLGGSNEDLPYSLIVDTLNQLIVYGSTGSNNFPVTAGSFDNSFNGGSLVTVDYVLTFSNGSDAFITKFNEAGSDLVGSTYIGGSGNDALNEGATSYNYGDHARGEVAIDESGNIYIASCTRSANLPTTPGVFQPGFGGDQDGFIAKFNTNLSALTWCSFIGGSDGDAAFSIKKVAADKYVICGGTESDDFTSTTGALNENYLGGLADGFVMTISADATSLINSTFIGTDAYDQTFLTEVDESGSIYITGQTLGDYPVVGTVYENPGSTQFISKLDPTLSVINFSTVFGNGENLVNISPTAFLVDNCSHIYVAGWGGVVNNGYNPATGDVYDMPITDDAYQSSTDGSDFYLVVFDAELTDILYSTYFGGPSSDEHVDGGTSRFDKSGVVYEAVCAGCGGGDDFPTTEGVVSNTNNSPNCNLGVFKFALLAPPTTAEFEADPLEGCSPVTVNFDNNSINAESFEWDFGDGATSLTEDPSHTFDTPGTYTVTLVATVPSECGFNDTTNVTITVYGFPDADFTFNPTPPTVFEATNFIDESSGATSWLWEFGDGFTSTLQNPTHLYAETGSFLVCLTVTNEFGCPNKTCDTIDILEQSILEVPNAFSPNGDGINDFFLPLNYGLEDFEFRIYNRWGELIFVSNDPLKGWDGWFNGKEQELDVYVYIVSGYGVDDVPFYKQGNFTLVR